MIRLSLFALLFPALALAQTVDIPTTPSADKCVPLASATSLAIADAIV